MSGSENLTFGNFSVENDEQGQPVVLGEGAFGRTFKTQQRFLNIPAAVKVIHDRWIYDETQKDAFLREAKIAASLDHPNIARVLDFGESEGRFYLALEFCAGGSLEEMVRQSGVLTQEEAVFVAMQTLQALAFAHESEVLHRDIKPSNLLIGKAGGAPAIKLIDFGLAVLTDHAPNPAEQGKFRGTPLFAAPEQLRDEPLDRRSDLFSLGMTLWWLLLGDSPEPDNATQVVESRLSDRPYDEALPELPPGLRQFLAALLRKERDHRPAGAEEALELLQTETGELFEKASTLKFRETEPDGGAEEAPPEIEPPRPEKLSLSLYEVYELDTTLEVRQEGTLYAANQKVNNEPLRLWMASEAMESMEGGREQLEKHLSLFNEGLPAFPPISRYIETVEGVSVVLPPEPCPSLQQVVRENGPLKLAALQEVLKRLVEGLGACQSAKLPEPSLDPRLIFWTPDYNPREVPLFTPRFLDVRTEEGKSWGYSTTVTAMPMNEASLSLTSRFSAFLYFCLAGRSLPEAANVSASAYVPTPLLSERTNRLLAMNVAGSRGKTAADVMEVLEEIFAAEGLLRRKSGASSQTASVGGSPYASARRSQVSSAASVPLPTKTAEPKGKSQPKPKPEPQPPTPEPGKAAAMDGVTEPEPARTVEPSPASAAAAAAGTGPDRKKAGMPLVPLGIALGVLLLGIGAFLLLKSLGEKEPAQARALAEAEERLATEESPDAPILDAAQTDARENIRLAMKDGLINETQRMLERYEALYGNDDFSGAVERSVQDAQAGYTAELRVPADQPTITAALEQAKPGQTIVIAPGTYPEHLRLKPGIDLRGEEGADIVIAGAEDGQGAVISLVEEGQVTLENLLLEPTRGVGVALLVDSGELTLRNVRLGNRASVGLRAQSKSRVVMENCVITSAETNGMELATESHLTMRGTRVAGNGRTGIYAQAGLVTMLLESGNTIENNGSSGLELEGGASLRMVSGELRSNGDAGVVAAGEGTVIRLEGVRVIANERLGISLMEGAYGVFQDLQVQENHGEGITFTDAKGGEILNCRIHGNGSLGIYLNASSEPVTVTGNQIMNHPQIGLAVTKARASVKQNTFGNNSLAMLFSTGAAGEARTNTVRKTADQEGIISEDDAAVELAENVVE